MVAEREPLRHILLGVEAGVSLLPELRLAALDGPEYGRGSMLVALAELETWLSKYPDDELRPDVERALVDCLQRLADNDMVVARFYRTVMSTAGARQHAARALETAKRAGNPQQLEEIRTFLEAVDEIESLGPPPLYERAGAESPAQDSRRSPEANGRVEESPLGRPLITIRRAKVLL